MVFFVVGWFGGVLGGLRGVGGGLVGVKWVC